MKIKFFPPLLLCFSFTLSTIAQPVPGAKAVTHIDPAKQIALPPDISEDWYNEVVKKISQLDYAFVQKATNSNYISYNKDHLMDFVMQPSGLLIKKTGPGNDNWEAGFNLESISKGKPGWTTDGFRQTQPAGDKLRFVYDHFDIEYINDRSGMRQNFIVREKPAGIQQLTVKMLLNKGLYFKLPEKDKLVCYQDKNNGSLPLFVYDGLKVWDANGTKLYAYMALDKNKLSIVVDDKKAVYPVTIDPLSHSPEWITSANGILPGLLTGLQLQVDALYGFNVTGLGDVNGDGFDDVAIGAPGAIDIIAGPTTIVGAGAVFVYFGSASGLSTVPDKILRANTAHVNALFGYSVAAGNVTGNTRNDIIIGSPGETYSTSVSGFPVSANVTAGKVYIFRGEDMSLPAPTPLLSIFLGGSTYFTNGVLGVLGSNISSNALFGFSVAASEDMTGDGLGEVIVGSPGYAELGLLPVRSGAAFVYYSGNLATNTPIKLSAPSTSLLDIALVNNQGLLFGFSVDGLGDYNQDGRPDVVVGAPAGLTISVGNLLGGTAYVFKGTSTGVNTTHITQLKAAASLVGSVANLFGYSVRGVRNASGVRNGNILVGAPSGNLLSNLVNGLKLKAGSVNVFKSKSITLPEEFPVQTIPSPRGSSLLSILGGQNLDVSALFGASIDNMLDVNCDGINDIIVGEPLSTSVGVISANVIGGAAAIFLGKPDGTYNITPYWNLQNLVSFNAGINAGSLLGYSVAGVGHVRGPLQGVRCLIGAPGAALDFSSGIFNLGGTFGTLFSFAAGNNGLGRTYMYGFGNCGVGYYPDVNITYVNVPVPGNVHTNDVVPANSTYGTPVPLVTNPPGASIIMFPDGTYTFTSTTPGVFIYFVPVCLPGEAMPCTPVELTITVLTSTSTTNPPVANTDIAFTMMNIPVTLKSLANDRCSNLGCSLNPASVQVTVNPLHGGAVVNAANGNVTYTPQAGFTGKDTLTYVVCDMAGASLCATAKQIITVYAPSIANTTLAADDYTTTYEGQSITGNVRTNDTDPESNTQTVVPQSTSSTGKGALSLSANGDFTFVPAHGYIGPVEFPYSTCDNGIPTACANATLYIMIIPVGTPLSVKVTAFSFVQNKCSIQLNWTSTQDDNLQQYVIDNSVNGTDWISLGTVDAKATGSNRNDYSFIHSNPVKGQNYYRIALIDKLGNKTYSNVLNAGVNCSNIDIMVNPNPFTNKLVVYFTAEKAESVTVNLFDNAGKTVASVKVSAKAGSNQVTLSELGWLAAGMYIIKVKTSAGTLSQKLVK